MAKFEALELNSIFEKFRVFVQKMLLGSKVLLSKTLQQTNPGADLG